MQNNIATYRKQAQITQSQLADICGVRRETIIRLEKGLYNPSLKLACIIAYVLKVDIYDLFNLEKPL